MQVAERRRRRRKNTAGEETERRGSQLTAKQSNVHGCILQLKRMRRHESIHAVSFPASGGLRGLSGKILHRDDDDDERRKTMTACESRRSRHAEPPDAKDETNPKSRRAVDDASFDGSMCHRMASCLHVSHIWSHRPSILNLNSAPWK